MIMAKDSDNNYVKIEDIIAQQNSFNGISPIEFKGNGENLENYRIYGNTVGDESVGDRTENLFDGEFLQGYWAYADGAWSYSTTWITTKKIPCKSSTTYTFSFNRASRWYGFVWFDLSGNYINTSNSGSGSNIQYRSYSATSPPNAAYMAIDVTGYPSTDSKILPNDITDFMLVENSTPLPYEPYGYKVPMTVEGKNLFNYGTITHGYRIQWRTGADYADETAIMSDFISVSENSTYATDTNLYWLCYDANKQYIGAWDGSDIVKSGVDAINSMTAISPCKFIRILSFGSRVTPISSTTMLNCGSTALPYEPYHAPVTTNLYLPEPIKMVGDEAEYIDFEEQKQHRVRKNLFDVTAQHTVAYNTCYKYVISGLNPNLNYTCSTNYNQENHTDACVYFCGSLTRENGVWQNEPKTYKPNNDGEIIILIRFIQYHESLPIYDAVVSGDIWIMVNSGPTPLPYEPYIENTELDVTLPALPTVTGTNVLSVETNIKPSKVWGKLRYPRDILYVKDNLGNILFSKYHEIEGEPPLIYKTKKADYLTNYRIYGQTVDIGDRRISVGDKTENLFDGEFLQGYWASADGAFVVSDKWICTKKIPCKANTDYTFTFGIKSRWYGIAWYDIDGNYIKFPNSEIESQPTIFTATSPANAAFMGVDIAGGHVGNIPLDIHPSDVTDLMLVEGTTALPYEPYGYKVPVTTGHSVPHTATLQLHDCLPSTMQFDAPEALYYAENGLTAGTYNFTIQDGYDTSYGGGKTYQFTLANDVPAKGHLVFGWSYYTRASAAKITSYASSTSTTAIEQVGVTEGSGGTSLGTTDGNSTNVNHIHRARFGSNNYKESAIRQFLNSSAVAGSVWTPQTKYDRPPSWNASTAGFMKDIDSDFLAVLGASPKVVALNTVTDGGGSVTINNDKFFLLSRSEVYGGKENNINEGEPYPYYSNYSDLSAAGVGDDSNRIKYRSGTAQIWWLRSPGSASGSTVRTVDTSGNVNGYGTEGISIGVAPACNIALDEDYKFNGQVLHVRDQISVTKGNQTLVFDVIGIDHDEVHFDKTTTNIYLPEPIKMVGDEAEYVDYATQKQHRVRKNLLPNTATNQTINGVTFTVNADGSVTCNGTASGVIYFKFNSRFTLPVGEFVLTGCPTGGDENTTYKILIYVNDVWRINDKGSGANFTLTETAKVSVHIAIYSGYTCNNLTFYPMIRLATIEDDTYEPYIENTDVDVTLPALPTVTGTNTLSVETEIQPSKINIKGKIKGKIYGWHVNPDISNSSNAVTYLKDAIGMTPASMGSTTFDYGSWENAFFMPKPCMLKSNGKVDYYLNPNDYTKKLDGTASDISNPNYDGNAMMQWPKIWFKYVKGVKKGQGYFYVANYKADGNFHCWCNYDSEDNEIDHFYTAIYNGTSFMNYSASKTYVVNDFAVYDNKLYKCNTAITTAESFFNNTKWDLVSNTAPAINKMRSLSGVRLTNNNGNAQTDTTTETTRATANNTTSAAEWYIETFSDRLLINGLLVLMGKSLNTQAVFGRGLDADGQSAKEAYVTGTLNDKGLFWGVTGNGNSGVKVFGMENFWGCCWHRTAGLITNNHVIKLKLTYGTKDGSTVVGYNQTGDGYIDNGTAPYSDGYVQKMSYNKYGFMPAVVTGRQSTYYADYHYQNKNSKTIYALFGGCSVGGLYAGAFYLDLGRTPGHAGWAVAASLSCKPLL